MPSTSTSIRSELWSTAPSASESADAVSIPSSVTLWKRRRLVATPEPLEIGGPLAMDPHILQLCSTRLAALFVRAHRVHDRVHQPVLVVVAVQALLLGRVRDVARLEEHRRHARANEDVEPCRMNAAVRGVGVRALQRRQRRLL